MKNRTLKKREIVEVLEKTLGLFRHMFFEYEQAIQYAYPKLKIGDWAIERSCFGQFPIEGILKITGIGGTSYSGIDLLGEKQTWENASFVPLPKHCQDFLNGKYRA